MKSIYYAIITLIVLNASAALAQTETFNYKKYTTGLASSFGVKVQTINRTTGEVIVSGAVDDNRRPFTLPIIFIWGDNTPNTVGYFPQTHRYSAFGQNYTIRAVADFPNNQKDTAAIFVDFTKSKLTPISIDPKFKVTIPNQVVSLPIRNSSNVFTRSYFNDSYFKGPFTRAEVEHILSAGNAIEFDLANGNVYQFNGKFEQYMLRDSSFGGGYAISYTTPVSLVLNDRYIDESQEPIGFTSIMHEMGHNMTLTMPANFLIGENIGGPGASIYAETMAQIFQHAVGYEMVNNPDKYGLDAVATNILRTDFMSSFRQLRFFYQQYVDKGMNYIAWNDGQNYEIITYTFGALAYKFCEYAENQGLGYRIPTKRLTQFLQRYDAEWKKRYDPFNNSPAGDAFRSTMMVAAVSHAFQKDLRADFRALKFPISDADWAFLNPQLFSVSTSELAFTATPTGPASVSVTASTSWSTSSSQSWLTTDAATGSGNKLISLSALPNPSLTPRTALFTISADGFTNQVVTITQSGASPTLATSSQSLSLASASAAPTAVTITSNTSWSVVSSQAWLVSSPGAGTGSQALSVSASANALAAPRTALLTVSANGVASQTITVTQAGEAPALTTSVASLTIEASGSSPSITIASNTTWSASSSQPWLTASPRSASSNGALVLTASANTGIESRNATVTVSASGVSSQAILVVQRGIIVTALANSMEEFLRIYPNPVSDVLQIEGLPAQAIILLFDTFGRLIHQHANVSFTHQLTMNKLPVGVYYLRIQSDQKRAVRPIIKIP